MNIPVTFVRSFAFVFTMFYYFFMSGDKYRIFFSLILMAIYLYMQSDIYRDERIKKKTSSETFWKTIHQEMHDFELVFPNVYDLHRPPKQIKYIFMNPQIKQIIEDLYFLRIYNKGTYIKVIIALEYFLRLHYSIMIEKYDACMHIQIMKDVRKEILNMMSALTLNVAPVSKIIDLKNMDQFIETKKRDLQGITGKYLSILRNKYKQSCDHQMDFSINFADHHVSNFDLYV